MRAHRMPFVTALLVLVLASLGLLTPQASPQVTRERPLLIRGATLIDGTGRAPLEDAAILIEGDRISAVGKMDEIEAPADAEIIGAQGKFVIPGLWESHMHFRWWHGELLLHYGITTAVDLGNQLEWVEAIKDGIAKGKVRAPRLFTAGWILHGTPPRPEGDRLVGRREIFYRTQAYQRQYVKENHPNHVYIRGGPEKMREFVRYQIDAGVDALKVFPDMSRDELRVISAEARRAGIPVIGHLKDDSLEEAFGAIEDGLNAITHTHGVARAVLPDDKREELRTGRLNTAYTWMQMDRVDALVNKLVEHGVSVGPGLIHGHPPEIALVREFDAEDRRILAQPELGYIMDQTRVAMPEYLRRYRPHGNRYGRFPIKDLLPEEVQAEFGTGYKNAKEFVRRFAGAGGKLFIGTDLPGGTPSIPGLGVHREMRVWVEEVGLTPMQALLAATRDSAAMMRKDDVLGTIEPGKIADLLVLNGDPLADIRNTQAIDLMLLNGVRVDRRLTRHYVNPFREVGHEGAHNISLPVPSIIGLTPRVVVEGAPDATVVLEGAGLHISSQVFVRDQLVPSTMLREGNLQFTIPAHLLREGGSLPVTVFNPLPGGGRSRPYGFIVRFK